MATTDQQMQLKDAMARAKQIAAKLQQQQNAPQDESRKRSIGDQAPPYYEEQNEPQPKRMSMGPGMIGGVDHTDPKVIAQQVANSLVQRAGFGSMLVEEVMIPNKLVGLVIGRGGEMINKLQSESGAKIQVAPDPPPDMAGIVHERQITITGMSDAVNKAKSLIDEIRNEGKVPERLLAGGGGPGEYSTEIQIPSSKVGLVIGKGGETIKSLQERAGCKMVLFQDGEFQNAPEKPLRISGEQSKVMYGKQLVSDLITQKELEAMGQDKFQQGAPQGGQPGPNYDEVQVPRDAVGFVIGSKGASINNIQQMTGCKVQFKNDMDGEAPYTKDDNDGEFKVAMLSGNPQQVQMAKAKLMEILQSHQDRKAGGGGSQGFGGNRGNWNGPQGGNNFNNGPRWGGNQGGGGGGGGGRQWNPRSSNFNQNRNQQTLPPGHKHMLVDVPANKCGLVIGKGGETLKFIHQDTKVDIEINRDVPQDSPVRTFHLRGNDEMIEHALSVVRDKINDQSIFAKPYDGPSQGGQESWNQGGGPGGSGAPGGWGGNNQGWNQNQPWQQGGGWGQPPQQQWGQAGWNQGPQGGWDQNQQQWGQYPWPYQQQQQAGQPAASAGSSDSSTTAATSTTTTNTATGQTDYSAAWALYYQQQQQYYQQYGMQQPGGTAAAASTATPTTNTTTTSTTSATADQSQSMAEYQAKLAEYYKSYGQQPPQQDQQQPPGQ